LIKGPAIIVGRKGTAGAVNYSPLSCYPIDTTFYVQIKDNNRLDFHYAYYQLKTLELDKVNTQSGVPGLNRNDAYSKKFALPPVITQREIVAEIQDEQALVNANCDLIQLFEKKINVIINCIWSVS